MKVKPMNQKNNIGELRAFVTKWNVDFPIDRWWRLKHNVAFNSSAHREVSFLDMRFEFEEDKLFEDLKASMKIKPYVLNSGNYMDFEKRNPIDTRTEEEKIQDFKDEFLNTDLSQFDG